MQFWEMLSAGRQQVQGFGSTSHTAHLQPLFALLPQPRHPALCRQVWDVSSAECLQDNALYTALHGEEGRLLRRRPQISKLSGLACHEAGPCRVLAQLPNQVKVSLDSEVMAQEVWRFMC